MICDVAGAPAAYEDPSAQLATVEILTAQSVDSHEQWQFDAQVRLHPDNNIMVN